jgi:hypothetical protein
VCVCLRVCALMLEEYEQASARLEESLSPNKRRPEQPPSGRPAHLCHCCRGGGAGLELELKISGVFLLAIFQFCPAPCFPVR